MTCEGGHCVTCSDAAVSMTVRALSPDGTAICDDGVEVMTDLLERVRVGDRLLVHAGVALQPAEPPKAAGR